MPLMAWTLPIWKVKAHDCIVGDTMIEVDLLSDEETARQVRAEVSPSALVWSVRCAPMMMHRGHWDSVSPVPFFCGCDSCSCYDLVYSLFLLYSKQSQWTKYDRPLRLKLSEKAAERAVNGERNEQQQWDNKVLKKA